MKPLREPLHGEDDQLWIGWKWFEYHAKQRLETFKFFIVAYGGLIGSCVMFLGFGFGYIALLLSLFSMLLILMFWQIDVRNRQLIGIGENIIGSRWDKLQFPKGLNPVDAANEQHRDGVRFKYAFLISFGAAMLFSIAIFALTVYLLSNDLTLKK